MLHYLKTRRFLAFLFVATLSFSIHSQSAKENSETWQVTSAWVKEVSPDQQAHAVFVALGALNKKTAELVAHRQDGEQVHWVRKIIACGSSMLSKVSTKNPELETYLRRMSDLHVAFIRGEIRGSQFDEHEAKLQNDGIALLKNVNLGSFSDTATQYKNRLADTEMSLVVYAMICASKKPK